MNERRTPTVRGWCPGALRPMQSGDGLIVRLRPRAGAFALAEVLVIADASARHGNGLIDLTRRANLQLRGIRTEALPALWSELRAADLLDDSADAEAVRNVLVSPLAGIDPAEIADVRSIARALECQLGEDDELWRLPAKFCFVVDGGGLLSLDGERADIRLKAIGAVSVALGIDAPHGIEWLGAMSPDAAADAAMLVARTFLEVAPNERTRMRDLDTAVRISIRRAIRLPPVPSHAAAGAASRALGRIGEVAAALAAPFGRLGTSELRDLAFAAREGGATEMRMSPWRTVYIPLIGQRAADRLIARAIDLSLIADAADPLLRVDACPGAPGCRSTSLDTRAAARSLAPLLTEMGCRSAHVSGCAKGCARSNPADLTLVGRGDCYGVLRHDTAQGDPRTFMAHDRLAELREAN
jgi:precorrin-3B synthase